VGRQESREVAEWGKQNDPLALLYIKIFSEYLAMAGIT
jgi:hypothetical protein